MLHHLENHDIRPRPASAEHSYVRDRSRIDVNRFWELRYWSGKFNVRPEDLKKAVEAVGTSPYAVAQYLGKAG